MDLPAPEATLAITPSCPHCPSMLEVLGQAVKQGTVAALHVINIEQQPEFAGHHRIRSVPWMKIGPFVLHGLHNKQEIDAWLARARSAQGMTDYLTEMLSSGELGAVTDAVRQSPAILKLFIPLISDDDTNINVRLGMGAILEELAGQPLLEPLEDGLITLLNHADARVRGDAAHFLAFTPSSAAAEALQQLQNDPDADVREIAAESLETLAARH